MTPLVLCVCLILALIYCVVYQYTAFSLIGIARKSVTRDNGYEFSSITIPLKLKPTVLSTSFATRSAILLAPPPSLGRKAFTTESLAMRDLKSLSIKNPTLGSKQDNYSYSISDTPTMDTSETLAMDGLPARRFSVSIEPNAFLTALATQERHVLELKEELQKAESDLEISKKQWASHETSKKKDEMRRSEKLQVIASPVRSTVMETEEPSPPIVKDRERRRAMYIQPRQPQRKVFAGSRHTKTLSLLNPTSTNYYQATSVPCTA